jgi:hypothetical protein
MPQSPTSKADLELLGINTEGADPISQQADSATLELDHNDPFVKAFMESLQNDQEGDEAPEVQQPATPAADAEQQPTPATNGDPAPTIPPTTDPPEAARNRQAMDEADNTVTDTFIVDIGNGQTTSITQDQAVQLLGLAQWASDLPAETRAQFAAIETGDAVAIPRDQYEAFRTFLVSQQNPTPQQRPSTQPQYQQPASPNLPPPDEYADDTTKALYAEVQRLSQVVQQQTQQQTYQQQAAQAAQIQQQWQAHVEERGRVFEETFDTIATNYGLAEQEVVRALDFAAESLLVAQVNKELTQINPVTGQIIREADPKQVAQITFERALHMIPELRQRVIDAEVQRRIDAEQNEHVNAKRSRAASLATAPSAATTTPNRDVRQMAPQELEAAIAAELRAAMG